MAEDLLITFLPNEVIELILEKEELSIVDVRNFALTCKVLHKIAFNNNKVWRSKFFQRWPLLREIYIEYEKNEKVKNWCKEVENCICSRKLLMEQLSLMSKKFYKKQELSYSELTHFDPLFRPEKGAHPLAYHFLVDELIALIILNSNLTIKYYAHKVVQYIKQCYLTDEWHKFLALPAKEQLLEQGATIAAQWSQPDKHVNYSHICGMLDDIVEQAKVVLREHHPSHPVFTTSPEQLAYWKNNNIDDNQWSIPETKQIMAALSEVMFNRLGFHGNSDMYYSSENSFIDRVLELKHGIPITLAIVFESICRRVGVKCELINFPAHFLLRWREKYTGLSNPNKVENFYIDIFNGGRFLTRQNCPRIGGASRCPIEKYNMQNALTAVEVVEKMATNLEVAGRQCTHLNGRASRLRSALELLHMVKPHDTGVILQLARFYMLNQMDLTRLVSILTNIKKGIELASCGPANHILQMLEGFQKRTRIETVLNLYNPYNIKERTPDVKYAIGMIMRHQFDSYLCVICGWGIGSTSRASVQGVASPNWIQETGIEELSDSPKQTYYEVLVDDGSFRYGEQENFVMATCPSWIENYEIGRYFCEFKKTHYLPNEEKAKQYPGDAEVREKLLFKYL